MRGSCRLRGPRNRLGTLRSGRLRSPHNPANESHALAAGIDAATVGVRVPGSFLAKMAEAPGKKKKKSRAPGRRIGVEHRMCNFEHITQKEEKQQTLTEQNLQC